MEYKGYKNKEKRKLYLLEYNRKWRRTEKGKKYYREYMRKRLENPEHRKKSREYQKEYNKINCRTEEYKKRQREYMRRKKGITGDEFRGTCGMGRKYEKLALNILNGSIDCNFENFRGKWDIEWNGLKIDVKARNFNFNRKKWKFSTKLNSKADYFLCFCIRKSNIDKLLFIPQNIFKNS
mgnify:FL=1